MVMKMTTRIPTTEPTTAPITAAFELEEPEEGGFPAADCVGWITGLEGGIVGCKGEITEMVALVLELID
jgi:hypothetical protein